MYQKSSVKVKAEVDSKHNELLSFYMRSFPEYWDKPEPVILLSILMSGEGEVIYGHRYIKNVNF